MERFIKMMEFDAKEINDRFLKSSIEGEGTSQEISDFREHAVQDFIRKYYPFPYRIAKGNISDSFGQRSDSIDCLVLNPNHPHTVNSHEKHSLILADGVDVAIEVKPDIATYNELERALKQGISVKRLTQRNTPLTGKVTANKTLVEFSKKIPYCIFTLKTKTTLLNTIEEIKRFYLTNQTPLIEQLDIIVILDKGIVVNCKNKEELLWSFNQLSDEEKVGWYFEEWGGKTLAGLLLHLQHLHSASIELQENYLKYYLLPKDMKINVSKIQFK